MRRPTEPACPHTVALCGGLCRLAGGAATGCADRLEAVLTRQADCAVTMRTRVRRKASPSPGALLLEPQHTKVCRGVRCCANVDAQTFVIGCAGDTTRAVRLDRDWSRVFERSFVHGERSRVRRCRGGEERSFEKRKSDARVEWRDERAESGQRRERDAKESSVRVMTQDVSALTSHVTALSSRILLLHLLENYDDTHVSRDDNVRYRT